MHHNREWVTIAREAISMSERALGVVDNGDRKQFDVEDAFLTRAKQGSMVMYEYAFSYFVAWFVSEP